MLPGMDGLEVCRRLRSTNPVTPIIMLTERGRTVTTAEQVSSVARQFGRVWRLTETYGCTGWDSPFLGHKAIGDVQAALGINLRCQHLAWYTMGGEARRDYPAPISRESPWWELSSKVEDYFARLGAVLTRGQEVRDLLVIHPVESAWTMVRVGWMDDPQVKAFDVRLVRLEDALLGARLDFDYGDEEILSRKASATRKAGRGILPVGKAAYSMVVVPPMLTVRPTTLGLLERFLHAGGCVVWAGEPPSFVDGAPSGAARKLASRCVSAPASGPELALRGDCGEDHPGLEIVYVLGRFGTALDGTGTAGVRDLGRGLIRCLSTGTLRPDEAARDPGAAGLITTLRIEPDA